MHLPSFPKPPRREPADRRRRRNRVANILHILWTTRHRAPHLIERLEAPVLRCVCAEAEELGATVLAINAMPDHVHLLVLLPPTVALSHLVKQVKGASSHLVNHELSPEALFRWCDGYAAFSVSRHERDKVATYVRNQKEHHADLAVRRGWEEL